MIFVHVCKKQEIRLFPDILQFPFQSSAHIFPQLLRFPQCYCRKQLGICSPATSVEPWKMVVLFPESARSRVATLRLAYATRPVLARLVHSRFIEQVEPWHSTITHVRTILSVYPTGCSKKLTLKPLFRTNPVVNIV